MDPDPILFFKKSFQDVKIKQIFTRFFGFFLLWAHSRQTLMIRDEMSQYSSAEIKFSYILFVPDPEADPDRYQ